VELLRGRSKEAERVLANLASGASNAIKQAMAEAGAIPTLMELLRSGTEDSRERAADVLLCLSNKASVATPSRTLWWKRAQSRH
jgi:hypothetical protein